jgi:predicted permease
MHDPQDTPAPQRRTASMWRRYVRFWGPRAADDVDDELSYHIEMRVRDYVARGMSEVQAREATTRRLGDLVAARSTCVAITSRRERRMTRAQLIDALVQDVRFALRTLGRQKAWTAVGILTLALGIGANAAVFSVVNNLLLHPLPYPHADRLVIVNSQPTKGNTTGMNVTILVQPTVLKAWRESAHSFEVMEGFTGSDVLLQPATGTPTLLRATSVLPSFPRFAGARPLTGRFFTDEDIASGAKVVVLGEQLWRSRYAGDSAMLGKSMMLDGEIRQVIGVMPASFRIPALLQDATDLWLPLDLKAKTMGVSIVGRLRPGVTHASAGHELDSIAARAGGRNDDVFEFRAAVVPPRELVHFKDSLLLLSGVAGLVLIIACANVAHLLLARGAARQRELAIRTAMGAGGGRLVRQLITESLVLSVAGCLGGIAVAWVGLKLLLAARPASLTQLSEVQLDLTTLLAMIAVSIVTGVVFGLVGVTQTVRLSAHDALKVGSLTTSFGRRHNRLRSLLVVTEMALSTTLLVGATLLVRNVVRLQMRETGFDANGLYAIRVKLPETSYPNPAARTAFSDELARRAAAIPGVDGLLLANGAPPGRQFQIGAMEIEGEPAPPPGTTSFINTVGATPGFFRFMGIRIVEGSTFTDTTKAGGQVIINEGMARKHWPGQSALGHRLRIVYAGPGDWMTIVGVVGAAVMGNLAMDASAPMLYLPGKPRSLPLVRTQQPTSVLPAIRAIVAGMDPRLPAPEITNINRAMLTTISGPRFTATLLSMFTSLALVLAAVGLYGVMAYGVAQRTREIGIRMALGATQRSVAGDVVKRGLALGAVGMLAGLIGAQWATKLVAGMLSGVATGDPTTFVIAGLVLLATAVAACIVPARRAVGVDPLIAMRAE